MTDKTKEAISDVVLKIRCGLTKQEALTAICSIVDEERKDEVVLACGFINERGYLEGLFCPVKNGAGKRGELVFRPREE